VPAKDLSSLSDPLRIGILRLAFFLPAEGSLLAVAKRKNT
jgi:hypothetical protein